MAAANAFFDLTVSEVYAGFRGFDRKQPGNL